MMHKIHDVPFEYATLNVGHPDWRLVHWRRVGAFLTFDWSFVRGEENVLDAIGGKSGRFAGAVTHPLGRPHGPVHPVLLPNWALDCVERGSGAASAGEPYVPPRFGAEVPLDRYVFVLFGRDDREIYDGAGVPVPFGVEVSHLFPKDLDAEAILEMTKGCEGVHAVQRAFGPDVTVVLKEAKALEYHRESRKTRYSDDRALALRIATGLIFAPREKSDEGDSDTDVLDFQDSDADVPDFLGALPDEGVSTLET